MFFNFHSTLLDVLAARKLVGTWSGEVYVDKVPRAKSFGRETAYVLQDDVHIPTLTVEETIRYAARTKLPDGTSKLKLENRVKLLLDMMGLDHVKGSRIGDGMTKGISGGQVKRLSIAVEIVHLPRLIFLDEPTSGLDSSIALEVMSTVRNITTIERTCVCTIHQPSREIFALFDKLVLISGGRLIFFGAPADAVVHFTQPELGFKFGGGYKNPADFLVDISCGQLLADGLLVPRYPEELEAMYKNSRFYKPSSLPGRTELKGAYERDDDPWGLDHSSRYVTSLWTQSVMLVERTWVAKIRDTADMKAQLVKNVSLGLILGILYYDDGEISGPFYVNGVTTPTTNSVNSFLFVFVMITMVANLQSVPFLCRRMHHYKRELASNAYAPFPFWISSLLVLAPILLFFHCIPVALTYGMMHFNSNAGSFLYFLFISYLGNMVSVTTAMALGANAPSEAAALILFPAQFLVFSTFSGFVIRIDDLPTYWQWMPYVSYPKWIFEALMVNEWKQYDTSALSGNGDVLGYYSFKHFQTPEAIWISLLFALGFSSVMYFGLLPPANRLVRVADACRASPQEGGGGLEDPAVVENPMFNREPRLTVDSSISANATELAKGCRLVFRDVQYSVTNKADGKSEISLLKGVTGRAMPGEMVALMGASGAGKSTLLDVLAQRKSTGKMSGEITYNGSPEMKSSSYVMQDNVHIGVLTVRESIYYAAELRMNQRRSKDAKARRVEKIIDMLGLQKVADTILGTHNVRGVSGGQLKRVSIGVEIVNLPNLMFLDEPTTGLDSTISLEVMSAVRNLANQNRTVICTIHQPSEETFALFDVLLLLAEGRVIYFGPALAAVEFFTQSPYQFVCRPGTNPADFAIAVGGSFLPAGDGRYIAGGEMATYYATTARARMAAERIVIPVDLLEAEQTKKAKQVGPYRTDLLFQLRVLLHRKWTVMQKNPFPVVWPIVR
jgi:ABC-type multidrug transport system ATPase subunit/ABC-type multidrug transport system permease subunit